MELTDGFLQEGRWRILLTCRPPSFESDDGVSILKECDVANGTVGRNKIHMSILGRRHAHRQVNAVPMSG